MLNPISEATKSFLRPIRHRQPFTDKLGIHVNPKHPRKFELSIYNTKKMFNSEMEEIEVETYPKDGTFAHIFVNRFPFTRRIGARREAECIEVGATDYTFEIIKNLWPNKDTIVFKNQAAMELFTAIGLISDQGDSNARRTALYKTKGRVPPHLLSIPDHIELTPYQIVQSINAVESHSFACFTGTGTGKTAVGIITANTCCTETKGRAYRVLVLCPKNVRFNWVKEWGHFTSRPYKATAIRGIKPAERTAQVIQSQFIPSDELNKRGHVAVTVMGYEAYIKTPDIHGIEWDLVILDESHSIANERTQRAVGIVELRNNSRRRIELTGTPIRNGTPMDLYTQFEYLGPCMSGFTSSGEYKKFFGKYERLNGAKYNTLTGLKNVPLLQERLARHAFILSKEEALKHLPEKSYSIVECSLTHEQVEVYNNVARELFHKYENELTGEISSLTVNNILTQMLRLAQITSGFMVTDPVLSDDGVVIKDREHNWFDPNRKFDELLEKLKDLFTENPNSKAQVWACFVPVIKKLKALFDIEFGPDASVTFYGGTSDKARIEAEDRFNCDDKCKIFIGHPEAGGIGLNLLGYDYRSDNPGPTNCDSSHYVCNNWKYTARVQSEGRHHRRGTRVPITIYDYLVPGSIDEVIKNRLDAKHQASTKLQDLKVVFGQILNWKPVENGD